jgi:ornithine--oxo-acid transaminase
MGALSLNGNAEFTGRFGPLLPGCDAVPFGDLAALEAELAREDVALFVVEPVQGKGCNLPPEGYLRGAQELCRRYGTLFCVDEVQTGFGRTGRMFACEHWGLEPDVMPVAKSLSGGYVPVGACLFRAEVFDAVFDSLSNALSHGSTFAPNDIAIAAGLATLHELDREDLVERSARLGAKLTELVEPLVERSEVVKEVRGLGLMWAIEFEEPPGGSRTWRMLERVQPGIFAPLLVGPLFHEERVLSQVAGHNLNVVKLLPPLCISDEDVEQFAAALERTVLGAQKLPRAMASFALRAARANRQRSPEPAGAPPA